VECFTAFHYKDALKGNIRALMDMIKSSEISDNRKNRKSTYVGTLESIVLPEQRTPASHNSGATQNYSEESSSEVDDSTNAGTTTSSSEPPVIEQV
jgi:hypothetical protein